jgi:hypothetical protein
MRFRLLLLGLALAGCTSAGPYGYSVNYSPLSDEEDAAEEAKEYDPVMIERIPEDWHGRPISVFGIVKSRGAGPAGTTDLTLSVRTLAPRNLCDEGGEETCRVTVSDHEFGLVHARVKLASEDDIGKQGVTAGSLVRVIGTLADDVHPDDGSTVLSANYYRHWPRNYFVTEAARSYMRR